jgi:hypothetical protein
MRAVFALLGPHPGPLPQGEGEKRRALFGDRISKNKINRQGRQERKDSRMPFVTDFLASLAVQEKFLGFPLASCGKNYWTEY